MKKDTLHALIAEIIGTFGLTFVVMSSIALKDKSPLATPIMAALTLMIFVYTIGSISGTHINPAVTIGLLAAKQIDLTKAIMYLIAQFAGAALAYALMYVLFTGENKIDLPATADLLTMTYEAIGAAIFTFGISAVVHGNLNQNISGLVIGFSLLLGVTIASVGSNGILNPAVAMALGSFSWSYVLGPIVGSVVGMVGYKVLCKNIV